MQDVPLMTLAQLHQLAEQLRARGRSYMIPSPDGSDYLERFALEGDLPREPVVHDLNIYLHRIIQTDLDRHVHNHPWEWSTSLILHGGYTEERLLEWTPRGGRVELRHLQPGMINILGPNDFHRIVGLHGSEVWTLFTAGRKSLDWGFMVPKFDWVSEKIYRSIIDGKAVAA